MCLHNVISAWLSVKAKVGSKDFFLPLTLPLFGRAEQTAWLSEILNQSPFALHWNKGMKLSAGMCICYPYFSCLNTYRKKPWWQQLVTDEMSWKVFPENSLQVFSLNCLNNFNPSSLRCFCEIMFFCVVLLPCIMYYWFNSYHKKVPRNFQRCTGTHMNLDRKIEVTNPN